MSFNPLLFIDVAKNIKESAATEEFYRSVVNRAYYGAYGYIKNKINFADYSYSSHQNLIDNFKKSRDREQQIIGKKLEALFAKRKVADYKYDEEFKVFNCDYCINEAQAIVAMFDKIKP
jgi:uncharacterized protein (UPF0332 family)